MIAKPLTLLLIGRSGCGKGTQAKLLIDHFKADIFIQTGDLFRQWAKQPTVAGKKIKKILSKGGLLEDWVAVYNEASLVKILEEYDIGRPSTYAPIISVIQNRNYVQKNEARRFAPTEMGELVNKLLTEHFPRIVETKFTAYMENELDEVAQGNKKWQTVIKEFYDPFIKNLDQKYEEVSKVKMVKEEKTDEVCNKCGKPMIIKFGRFGKFLACSGFPDCKNAKTLKSNEGQETFGKCPKCNKGEIIKRRTKRGWFFYGCSEYPDCDHATWKKPVEKTMD